jgi:hypothetical protein
VIEPLVIKFDTRHALQAQWRALLARAGSRLCTTPPISKNRVHGFWGSCVITASGSNAPRSPRSLRHLSDSFALADGLHVVRRFHCDHMRGEAAFGDPGAALLPAQRFDALWEESRATLSPSVAGL